MFDQFMCKMQLLETVLPSTVAEFMDLISLHIASTGDRQGFAIQQLMLTAASCSVSMWHAICNVCMRHEGNPACINGCLVYQDLCMHMPQVQSCIGTADHLKADELCAELCGAVMICLSCISLSLDLAPNYNIDIFAVAETDQPFSGSSAHAHAG